MFDVYELGFKEGGRKGGWRMISDEDGGSKQETIKVGERAGKANGMHLHNYSIWGGRKALSTAREGSSFHIGRSLTAIFLY